MSKIQKVFKLVEFLRSFVDSIIKKIKLLWKLRFFTPFFEDVFRPHTATGRTQTGFWRFCGILHATKQTPYRKLEMVRG